MILYSGSMYSPGANFAEQPGTNRENQFEQGGNQCERVARGVKNCTLITH